LDWLSYHRMWIHACSTTVRSNTRTYSRSRSNSEYKLPVCMVHLLFSTLLDSTDAQPEPTSLRGSPPGYSGRTGTTALQRHGFQFHWSLSREPRIYQRHLSGLGPTVRLQDGYRFGVGQEFLLSYTPRSQQNEEAPRHHISSCPIGTVLAKAVREARTKRTSQSRSVVSNTS
jgi:hypothetical protein